MKKQERKFVILGLTLTLLSCISIASFAGEWKQDTTGWWYQNDNGSYPVNGWEEINGKQYYFDGNGYMLVNTTTPDGYQVGGDGAWLQNSQVQDMRLSWDNREVERWKSIVSICSYNNTELKSISKSAQNRTEEDKKFIIDIIDCSCYFGAIPFTRFFEKDYLSYYPKEEFDNLAMDCFGVSVAEYIPYATWLEEKPEGYQGVIGDFGLDWPYCDIIDVQETESGLILSGYTGNATSNPEFTVGMIWDATSGLYKEKKQFKLILRYNPDATYSKFSFESISIDKN